MSIKSSFSEVSKEVDMIGDFIISDLANGFENTQEEKTSTFKQHLVTTRYWFCRISSANKKRFLLALVKDIRSATALSLLLKSIWNCRPKDAVLSASCKSTWSSYDQAPLDHDRTALPLTTLAKVVKSEREWFQTLETERQASFLLELLAIAGGSIMWAVLQKSTAIYDNYRKDQLLNIKNSMALDEKHPPEPVAAVPILPSILKGKSQKSISRKMTLTSVRSQSVINIGTKSVLHVPRSAKNEYQQRLNEWNSVIQSMKDNFKLEEIETTFNDGSQKKIWKVKRNSPEGTETVDFVQLLPGVVAKRILSYLPHTQLARCANVNNYWAYLIDDMKREKHARLQLEIDIIKLETYMNPRKIGSSKMRVARSTHQHISKSSMTKILHRAEFDPPSTSSLQPTHISNTKEESSFRRSACSSTVIKNAQNQKKPKKTSLPPIRKMAALSEDLNRRGALDDKLWNWCDAALKRGAVNNQTLLPALKQDVGGVMAFDTHFPGPLMAEPKQTVEMSKPASAPVTSATLNQEDGSLWPLPDSTSKKLRRFSLWSHDFAKLYPAFKIASYQSPM